VVKRSTSAPSPLSPTLWPADAFRWYASLAFALALAAAFVIPSIIFSTWIVLTYHTRTIANVPVGAVIAGQLLAYVPVLAVLYFGLPALARRSWRELGLRVPGPREIGWGLLGTAAMFAIAQAIGAIEESVFHFKLRESAVDILRHAHGADLAGFAFVAVIAAPLVEESIFRGFFFNAFLRYMPAVVAGLLSATLFGFLHYAESPTVVLPLIGAGAALAWVYYRSGALISTIIAHGTFNAITVLAVMVQGGAGAK